MRIAAIKGCIARLASWRMRTEATARRSENVAEGSVDSVGSAEDVLGGR